MINLFAYYTVDRPEYQWPNRQKNVKIRYELYKMDDQFLCNNDDQNHWRWRIMTATKSHKTPTDNNLGRSALRLSSNTVGKSIVRCRWAASLAPTYQQLFHLRQFFFTRHLNVHRARFEFGNLGERIERVNRQYIGRRFDEVHRNENHTG